MIKKFLFLGALGLTGFCSFAQTKAKPKPVAGAPLKSLADSASYAIGQDIGNTLKSQGLDHLNTALLIKAIQDATKDQKPLLTQEQSQMSIREYLQKIAAEKSSKNKAAGDAFLAANKAKPGVTTLPDGLQYLVLKEGTGPKPTANDRVKTHYHGTLIDGTVFDSSVDRGQPITFAVGGVIKGWTEALQLMPVGSKWRLFIPADLAYGDRQQGPKIGPNSTLVFDVELLEIVQ
ncbi:FKBP-type peptidyl-prolyl cis-trans isomerase [Chitinophaga agrisoli]|uniref:Peptidyl-prolyl cis-trans isomerase n=1 Tax=Chitinophaga agrisoli TaxID=2607653 RepID=A0A5B2VUL7_9BACT|nr:FKBP-type peptidyl-prolyl cis-trans isomerase [Chitinophaga agrisoli]KAA2241886.1 FKBP-type peptidyl-prolyl cis-trans isomerase [Chitinophaga agrisoli]